MMSYHHRSWPTWPLLSLCLLLLLWAILIEASPDAPFFHDYEGYQAQEYGIQPSQTFHSAPSIKAPIYQVTTFDYNKTDKAPYIFLTGGNGYERFGPSIVSAKDLSLIWSDENYVVSQAAQNAVMKGQPVLAVYNAGHIWVYNQHYQPLYKVHAQGNQANIIPDGHECHVTMDETVILIYNEPVLLDLTSIGGPREGDGVRNSRFQEIDPVTNQVIFEFSTLDYFRVEDTNWPYGAKGVFWMGEGLHDFAHMNSVEKTPDGDYLVSYRHFDAVILIDGKTSQVKWCMGGKRNEFRDISEHGSAVFNFQHNARLTAANRFTLFDNARLENGLCPEGATRCSRGLEIEFDAVNKTMKMINEWYHPKGLISASRGGIHRLSNGNTLIAWGQNGAYTEHSADGEVVLDIQRSPFLQTEHGILPIIAYRAWKGDWEGKPLWGPNISASAGEDGQKWIYVSWNGATGVVKWVLLLSDTLTDLDGFERVASETARMGFETAIELPWNAAFARVAAIDKFGHLIGSTPAVNIESGMQQALDYAVTSVWKTVEVSQSPATLNAMMTLGEMTIRTAWMPLGIVIILANAFFFLRKGRKEDSAVAQEYLPL